MNLVSGTFYYVIPVLKGLAAEENATLLERTAPYITVPSHIVWGQEDQVRFNTFTCRSH